MKVCEPVEQAKVSARPNFPIALNKLYINGEWRDSTNGKTFPAIANSNPYGLASGVHTRDIKKAHKAAAHLKAGTVWVNTYGHFEVENYELNLDCIT
ncbi:aldehyde dehydrogenase family protein [Leptolyngbya sp. 7M]|uniref:aldehyde dehydrogenase family protein n=1 Tax=Leptolyngbya sp. 7M TaxID=2812896 RepID=UPI001B8BAA5C|nr:aldehyde dehydrogenase family protein [Leptolyngbya sp. 7M]QYO63939.1 aldehyde dehydrogenase family protein [Leptolyngbya sp. 7M]